MSQTFSSFLLQNLTITSRLGFEWQALCPYHEDNTPSFSINVRKRLFICYACGAKGNMAQLIEHLGHDDDISVEETHPDEVLEKTRQLASELRDTRSLVGITLPTMWFSDKKAIADYWCAKRFISEQTVADFGLGMNVLDNQAIIPVRAMNGNTIGCIRRVLDEDAPTRYLYSRGMKTSNYLFGADVAKSMMFKNKDSRLVITEGAVDAMTFTSSYNIPAVAMFGSRLSVPQCNEIKKLGAETIFIATDMDRAGRMASLQVEELLRNARTGALLTQLQWSGAKDINELLGRANYSFPDCLSEYKRIQRVIEGRG